MPGIIYTNWRQGYRGSGSHHVLIMSDNPALLDLLEHVLSDDQYVVTLATFQLQWGQILMLQPDLVIADPTFIVDQDRSIRPNQLHGAVHTGSIPIIYFTRLPEVARSLSDLGCTTLRQPFDLDRIQGSILDAFV